MADLIAQAAVTGLPLNIGRVTLARYDPGPVTSIAPFPGRDLSPLLAFPAPGEVVAPGAGRLIWAGRELALLIGAPAPDLTGLAALTDQSDGWAWVTIHGGDTVAALSRLTALDLRPGTFAVGTSARALLNHLPALLIRTAPDAFQIAVFRSMARTLVHEIEAAMRAVAARTAL